MDPTTALNPAIFVPFITAHNLADPVLCLVVVLADAHFSTDNFQNFDILSAAFSSACIAAPGLLADH